MKHLVSISDLSKEEALYLLDNAQNLTDVNKREVKKLPSLRGRTVVNLFFENSTRTRISFEIAATRLSADVIDFSAQTSSLSKGESLKDTAQTLEALGADAIILRHPMSGAAHRLAHSGWISASVINAGDGQHEHPTQALLDALTIQQVKKASGDLTGLRVLIVGDILHSRVAKSNLKLLTKLGAEVELAGPLRLVPESLSDLGASVSHSFEKSLAKKPDVVMMLRVQRERIQGGVFPSEKEYLSNWSLGGNRLELVGEDAHILHPGPMNRGFEISAAAADDPRSVILTQVQNGVAVRMAVLHELLAGERN